MFILASWSSAVQIVDIATKSFIIEGRASSENTHFIAKVNVWFLMRFFPTNSIKEVWMDNIILFITFTFNNFPFYTRNKYTITDFQNPVPYSNFDKSSCFSALIMKLQV